MKTLVSGKWQMFSKLQLDNCRLYVSKPNILTEIEVSTGKGTANVAGRSLELPPKASSGVVLNTVQIFSSIFNHCIQNISMGDMGIVLSIPYHDHSVKTVRWPRHKKEGRKRGHLRAAHCSFQSVVLRRVAALWVWTQSGFTSSSAWFACKGCSSAFYDHPVALWKNIFNFVEEFFCQGYKCRPSPRHFYGFPCVFHRFYVLLQMGPGSPDDNFSFPLAAAGLHRLAGKVFVTASSPLSVSGNRTLCCWVERNDSFLLWQHPSCIDKHHHKFGIHLSESRRPRFSIPHKIID